MFATSSGWGVQPVHGVQRRIHNHHDEMAIAGGWAAQQPATNRTVIMSKKRAWEIKMWLFIHMLRYHEGALLDIIHAIRLAQMPVITFHTRGSCGDSSWEYRCCARPGYDGGCQKGRQLKHHTGMWNAEALGAQRARRVTTRNGSFFSRCAAAATNTWAWTCCGKTSRGAEGCKDGVCPNILKHCGGVPWVLATPEGAAAKAAKERKEWQALGLKEGDEVLSTVARSFEDGFDFIDAGTKGVAVELGGYSSRFNDYEENSEPTVMIKFDGATCDLDLNVLERTHEFVRTEIELALSAAGIALLAKSQAERQGKARQEELQRRQEVKSAFEHFDTGRKGYITKADLFKLPMLTDETLMLTDEAATKCRKWAAKHSSRSVSGEAMKMLIERLGIGADVGVTLTQFCEWTLPRLAAMSSQLQELGLEQGDKVVCWVDRSDEHGTIRCGRPGYVVEASEDSTPSQPTAMVQFYGVSMPLSMPLTDFVLDRSKVGKQRWYGLKRRQAAILQELMCTKGAAVLSTASWSDEGHSIKPGTKGVVVEPCEDSTLLDPMVMVKFDGVPRDLKRSRTEFKLDLWAAEIQKKRQEEHTRRQAAAKVSEELKELKDSFKFFDADGKGYITKADLLKCPACKGLTDEDADDAIAEAGGGGAAGRVNFAQFCAMMGAGDDGALSQNPMTTKDQHLEDPGLATALALSVQPPSLEPQEIEAAGAPPAVNRGAGGAGASSQGPIATSMAAFLDSWFQKKNLH